MFGELGLLNNKPRAATIIIAEDSIFATLPGQNFKSILAES